MGPHRVRVNNAMATVFAPESETTPAEFRRVTEVTYLGQVHGTLRALKHMRKRGGGRSSRSGPSLRIDPSRFSPPIALPRRQRGVSRTRCAPSSSMREAGSK